MENLFGDAFEIESIENVEVIDTDPNVYVKRAEEELKNRRYRNAINEMDDAIKYCEDKALYMLEKVKILNASSYVHNNMRMECINYIKNNLNTFYSDLNINKFIEIIGYYNDCFNKSKSNITEVLKSKGIPYILGEGYSNEEYINKGLILKKAEIALLEKRLDDALSHISIIEYKYSMDRDCFMVKGQIFKSLKDYDNAIACFSRIISNDILDFEAILQLNITKCIKYKKVIVGAILVIIILILTQFMLFKNGILPSHVKSYDINVSNGRYIKEYDDSIVIPLGETIDIDLQYKLIPFYGELGDISYTVEDETIISVDGNKKVTGLKTGETNLNVLRNGEIEHTIAFSVVVSKVDSIELNYDNELSYVGDYANVIPRVFREYNFNEENKIIYKSSNESVLTINENGEIKAVGVGVADISVTCDNITVEDEIIINPFVEDIIVDPKIEIEVGDTYKFDLSIKTMPENANHPQVTYELGSSSSDNSSYYYSTTLSSDDILELNNDGSIKAISEGTQEVIIKCGNYTENTTVVVNKKSIQNSKVENLKGTSSINENYLKVELSWDHLNIEDNHSYNIYAKYDDSDFSLVRNVDCNINDYNSKDSKKISETVSFDISDENGSINIPIYVEAINNIGEKSDKSNIVNISVNYKNNNNNNSNNINTDIDNTFQDELKDKVELISMDEGAKLVREALNPKYSEHNGVFIYGYSYSDMLNNNGERNYDEPIVEVTYYLRSEFTYNPPFSLSRQAIVNRKTKEVIDFGYRNGRTNKELGFF